MRVFIKLWGGLAAAVLLISACSQSSPPEVSSSSDSTGGSDTIAAILEQLQSEGGQNKDASPSEQVVPSSEDELLAADALAAAFDLVRRSTDIDHRLKQDKEPRLVSLAKPSRAIRAAMLIPLNGTAKTIGTDMRHGAEQAIFSLDNDQIDLTFHDTSQGAERAMADALSQNVDVVIGPLFADDTLQAHSRAASTPILSFSNDSTISGGDVWLVGQTPEQEIEMVLTQALKTIRPIAASGRPHLSLAILAQNNAYGTRLSSHAIDVIQSYGQTEGQISAELLTLDEAVLADEKILRGAIKNLTKWVPPDEDASVDESVKPPEFDIVVIAGDARFSLQVAPVLNWYDLDPSVVQYLGPSTWDNPIILQEPSLNGGWFAQLPSEKLKKFSPIWSDIHKRRASPYAIMAFDTVAVISTLDHTSPQALRASLLRGSGFSGFSGMFRFNPDGSTSRQLEIRKITPNGYDVVQSAPVQF